MKKILASLLSISLIALLVTGLFACKKETERSSSISESELALHLVEEALPTEENPQEIADALLALFRESEMEKGEILDALTALKEEGPSVAPALLALQANLYSQEDFTAIRDALRVIAKAVSPEVAGEVYYAAAKRYDGDLPYSRSDCRKIAVFYFSQDESFSIDLLEELRAKGSTSTTRKQLNTALITLASSLGSAQGISASAKEYFFSKANEWLDSFTTSTEETAELTETSKNALKDILVILRDHFDIALSYFARFFSYSDARLFLGADYDRKESTRYYGYHYEGWVATELTEEEYLARAGDYDEYFTRTYPQKGYYEGYDFIPLSDEDVALAENVYRLRIAYRAYQALDAEEKSAFRSAAHAVLSALTDKTALLSGLLNKPLIEPTEEPGATFDELIAALAPLSDVESADGFDQGERSKAEDAVLTFERYLHGYLPTLY